MAPYLVRIFDNPIAENRKELEFKFVQSLDEAHEWARDQLRLKHKPAGYRIEDITGRTVDIRSGIDE